MEENTRKRSIGTFWSRAADIVNPVRYIKRPSDAHDSTSTPSTPPDGDVDGSAEKSALEAASSHQSGPTREQARREDRDRRRYVATIPPWIHSVSEGEDTTVLDVNDKYTLSSPIRPATSNTTTNTTTFPAPTRPATHHYLPLPVPRLNAPAGRRFDHERSNEPPIPHAPLNPSQWTHFVRATDYRPATSHAERSTLATPDWVAANMPDLDAPWDAGGDAEKDPKDERIWLLHHDARMEKWHTFQDVLMRNPFVPLAIRITVLLFVLAALALGCYIYKDSRDLNSNPAQLQGTSISSETDRDSFICKQQPSTYLAFIVDSVAVIYTVYITYDEYFSKPLGLRRSRDKMRLLFLDLIFIIFSAANLSLAFDTLTDQQWACFHTSEENTNNAAAATSLCVYDGTLCRRQMALVSVLTVAEVAWVMTFTISTLRVVERISR